MDRAMMVVPEPPYGGQSEAPVYEERAIEFYRLDEVGAELEERTGVDLVQSNQRTEPNWAEMLMYDVLRGIVILAYTLPDPVAYLWSAYGGVLGILSGWIRVSSTVRWFVGGGDEA